MRGTTKAAAIATSFFASMGSAFAADLSSTKEPMPYMPPALIWSGCYVGANVGYGWQMDRSYDPNLALNAGSDTANGIVGGGQVGCDYQTGALVLGLQGSFDGAMRELHGHLTLVSAESGIGAPQEEDILRLGIVKTGAGRGAGKWVVALPRDHE